MGTSTGGDVIVVTINRSCAKQLLLALTLALGGTPIKTISYGGKKGKSKGGKSGGGKAAASTTRTAATTSGKTVSLGKSQTVSKASTSRGGKKKR